MLTLNTQKIQFRLKSLSMQAQFQNRELHVKFAVKQSTWHYIHYSYENGQRTFLEHYL